MKTKLAALVVMLGGTALAADTLLVNGAGATFPYPLYSKWFSEYNRQNPSHRFNYQSIGSGGGIQQITKGTVDFGASDAPMTEEELAKAPDLVHLPTVLGAVVVTYNGLPDGLKLTQAALADVFLGKITKWNDAAIAKENPNVTLPDLPIAVIRRSDGSGTTAIFTDFLAKVSPAWKEKVGAGKSVKWPVGLGGKGNEGVTGLVKATKGSIGYVELAYAHQNKLPLAAVQNKERAFVMPSIGSTSAAAKDVTLPDDFRVSITNAPGKDAYPLASFTYLLVHRDQADKAKGEALVKFLWWATHDGQKLAEPLDYAPLPDSVVKKVEAKLKSLTVQGQPVALASSK
jgi:phosphate transport system substrate-binding protein